MIRVGSYGLKRHFSLTFIDIQLTFRIKKGNPSRKFSCDGIWKGIQAVHERQTGAKRFSNNSGQCIRICSQVLEWFERYFGESLAP
jgi:hypothetical protein